MSSLLAKMEMDRVDKMMAVDSGENREKERRWVMCLCFSMGVFDLSLAFPDKKNSLIMFWVYLFIFV